MVSGILRASGFYITLAALLFTPILWGSARPWAWYPMELVAFLGLFLFFIGKALDHPPGADGLEGNPPVFITIALFFFLGFVLFQTVPLPDSILSFIAPASFRYYSYVPDSVASISVDKGVTFKELLLYASYVSAFFVLYSSLVTRFRFLALIYCLVLVALFEAVFGIYAMYKQIYIVPKELVDGHFQAARGTYVNPNHYAGYLMSVGGITLGMLYGHLSKRWERIRRLSISDVIVELGSETGVWIIILSILVTGALFSGSRGAPAASLLALIFVVSISIYNSRKEDLRIIVPVIVVLVISVIWLGAGTYVVEMVREGAAIASRIHLWSLSLDAVREHWLLGSGAGTFALIFTGFRDGTLSTLHYDTPHNDYLELLTELGVLGSLGLFCFVVILLQKLIKAYLKRRSYFYRGILFGCSVSIIAFLIHSIVEFNFRIPANALLFFAICALGLKAATIPNRR